MFDFIRKNKKKLENLEQAKEQNLITEKEFLELKVKRAEEELKTFLEKDKKK